MTTQHTATPWNVGEMGSGTLAIYGRSRKAPLCQFGEGIDEARTEPKNAQADATFIVKACNAHDELVAALRCIDAALNQNKTFPADVELARAECRAALAKVSK